MSFGLSDTGEKKQAEAFIGEDVDITIYLDNTDINNDGTKEGDDLTDSSDLTNVTTEPINQSARVTKTIQSSDIVQIDGDWGFSTSAIINLNGVTGKIDGTLIIESGTDNIITRGEIQDPEPGPYQSLDGLEEIEIQAQLTND